MRWLVIGVAALLVGLLGYGVAQQGKRTGTSSIDAALGQGRDDRAPATSLPRLGETGRARVAAYQGKVVLVNFWASWCKPCTSEMPALQRLQRRMAPRGGTVLGIASRDNSQDAMAFVRRFSVSYPNLRDGSGDVAERWGVFKQPESFLLDRSGRIVAHRIGAVDPSWLRTHVDPLLT